MVWVTKGRSSISTTCRSKRQLVSTKGRAKSTETRTADSAGVFFSTRVPEYPKPKHIWRSDHVDFSARQLWLETL
ncbi:hypothetical protein M408DRAFT_121588 [Serendipita vermifera MAFF 305830]|uniref:Uncharacterized protein n=1 Tax=Serendipita vermifera MAFF 305830 TaxID=933852 RepID=A0A0C3AXL2_SERVB|nr:hypothetical protein M408DRAFT_121588 [Serendipita vermifera MAFF 305830]